MLLCMYNIGIQNVFLKETKICPELFLGVHKFKCSF